MANRKKTYPYQLMMTPYEKLKSLEEANTFLKEDITFEDLDKIAFEKSDLQSAKEMQKAKQKLFQEIFTSE